MRITKIEAREILDSRGFPTIETEVILADGSLGVASIPSDGMRGKDEAIELRDNDPKRFHGYGVLQAVKNVNEIIAPRLINFDAAYQGKIDQFLISLDAILNKSKLGSNALLSVSQAVLEASAASYKLPIYTYLWQKYQLADKNTPLPGPIFSLINGRGHGSNNLDFQDFQIIPSRRKNYHDVLKAGEEIYQALRNILIYRGATFSVGDDGSYNPKLFTNLDALEILLEAITETGYEINSDIFLGMDVDADNFYNNGFYKIRDRTQPFSRDEMIKYYQNLNSQYHLFSISDPLMSDDWDGWEDLEKKIGEFTLIIGDDLLTSSKKRIKKAFEKSVCQAILIKPTQLGTISETVEIIKICRRQGWKIIVSNCLGETNDDFIADFSCGMGADYSKFGAPARGERVAKYNRLLKIADDIRKKS